MGLKSRVKEKLNQYIESRVGQQFNDLKLTIAKQQEEIVRLNTEIWKQQEEMTGQRAESQKWKKDVEKILYEVENYKNIYGDIDYFDFENYFRGSLDEIRNKQLHYISYFKNRTNVLDIGCGRGEFLSLLKENDIDVQGVDLYPEFVEMCRSQGLQAALGDGIEYLKSKEKWGGIFVGQVVEHLHFSQIVTLCKEAYNRLEEGAYIILETPNPTTLCTYACAFYMDPSHNRPVHPAALKYVLEKAGFAEIKIQYTEESKYHYAIPPIRSEAIENLDDVNYAVQVLNDLVFGSMDYAIIARKSS